MKKTGSFLGFAIAAALTAAWYATRALADDAAPATPATEIDPKLLIAAVVPIVTFAVKWLFDKLPDGVVIKIRDRWIPLLVPLGAALIESITRGEVDLQHGTQAALVGLAGVGIHQIVVQLGLRPKTGALIRTDAQAGLESPPTAEQAPPQR